MTIYNYNTEEIFSIFDIIKMHLNEILTKGVVSFSKENYTEMVELKKKLEKMHLNTLNYKMDSFLVKIDQLVHTKASKELKMELAIDTLQIITIIRMFERIMTLECVKNQLIKEENKK